MRLNLSNVSKPIKRHRYLAHIVSAANSFHIMKAHSKFSTWKQTPCDSLSVDPKFSDVADFDCWSQQGSKFRVGSLKRKMKMNRFSLTQTGVDVAASDAGFGRQDLIICRRRRAIRQHHHRQVRRFWALRKQFQRSMDMVDADQISQWSVPVDIIGSSGEDNHLESFFSSHNHNFPLVRSHSQQNFRDFDETEIYSYETASIEFPIAYNPDSDYQGNVSNVEPHLNFFMEKSESVQIQDDLTNESNQKENAQQGYQNHADNNSITQNYIKDEDNLFDNLCHSGCVCSDSLENSEDQHDLLRCAEIQKSEITAKAFLVYVDYYATKCYTKALNGNDITTQAKDNWQILTQKEKLPFLLQAYISDYLPQN